jgi:hypothetical protein
MRLVYRSVWQPPRQSKRAESNPRAVLCVLGDPEWLPQLRLYLAWRRGVGGWGCRPAAPTLVTTCSQKISCAIGSTRHQSDTKDSSGRWNCARGASIAAKKKRAAEAALFASIAYAAPLLIRRHVLKRRPDVRIPQLNSPGRRDSIPVVPVVVGLRVRGLGLPPRPAVSIGS